MPKGTRLVVGPRFKLGEDHDIKKYLGQVVTFDRFESDKWVYFEESEYPFRYDEIERVFDNVVLDELETYEIGDMKLILCEVIK